MTWTPEHYPLAAGKDNATTASNDHPEHHNQLATLANSIVSRVQTLGTEVAGMVELATGPAGPAGEGIVVIGPSDPIPAIAGWVIQKRSPS